MIKVILQEDSRLTCKLNYEGPLPREVGLEDVVVEVPGKISGPYSILEKWVIWGGGGRGRKGKIRKTIKNQINVRKVDKGKRERYFFSKMNVRTFSCCKFIGNRSA